MKATFVTTLTSTGNNTGIEVPPDIIAQLGDSKKPAVIVTVSGYTFHSTVGVMGGKYLIAFSAAHRKASGLKGGDPIDVTLELDETPRTVVVPGDLALALAGKPGAAAAFEALAFSKRNEYVRQVEEAKTSETRDRRIAAIVANL